jgi:hypothetical protein
MGFIKVVDVEQQIPLWGAIESKVHEMGITTELHHQTRVWLAAEIRSHHRSGATEKSKWALGHATVANRHEPGQSLGLLLD